MVAHNSNFTVGAAGSFGTDPSLSQQAFDRDGFVDVRGFLSASDARALLNQVERFIREIVPKMPPEHVFYEDKERHETLKQLQSMHTYDEYFGQLFEQGRLRELAAHLLQDEVRPVNMQYFNKPASVGLATPAHQDGYYFMLDPCEAVTMWLSLEHVDEENGCVRYVRESHCRGMRPHGRTRTLGFSQGITDFPRPEDLADEVALPTQPGDLLVHHAMTIHRADGNRATTRSRRALGFVYFAQRTREDAVAKAAYQARLTAEWKKEGKL